MCEERERARKQKRDGKWRDVEQLTLCSLLLQAYYPLSLVCNPRGGVNRVMFFETAVFEKKKLGLTVVVGAVNEVYRYT